MRLFLFCKQKTAYEMRISDWSSDVCSSDLPAAKLLDQAAAITTNPSLKKFLSLRAKAFRTDDYYASELAWMDLKDTPIEIAIGPYEVYTDRLFGQKAAFESFVTLKDPEDSAALAKYKAYLNDRKRTRLNSSN